MSDLHVVILAAGKSTRMKSERPKVLHPVAGRPMIEYVLTAARSLSPKTTTVVVGHMKEQLQQGLERFPEFGVCYTGAAAWHWACRPSDRRRSRRTRRLCVVAIWRRAVAKRHTLAELVKKHEESGAAATVLTSNSNSLMATVGSCVSREDFAHRRGARCLAGPTENQGNQQRCLRIFVGAPLRGASRPRNGERSGEYYLTDLISTYRRRKLDVETVLLEDSNEIRGINSRSELAEASRIVKQKKNEELMAAGVTIEDPATTYIDEGVVVGADTVIHPGVHLEGRTEIGQACEIHAGVRIINSRLDDRVTVQNFCVINGSRLGPGVTVGPFVHMRPDNELHESRTHRQFCRVEEIDCGQGQQSRTFVIPRRRRDRREREHRRGHDHVQLRRGAKASDHH